MNYISPVSETVEEKSEAVLVNGTNETKVTGTASDSPNLEYGGDTQEGTEYTPG